MGKDRDDKTTESRYGHGHEASLMEDSKATESRYGCGHEASLMEDLRIRPKTEGRGNGRPGGTIFIWIGAACLFAAIFLTAYNRMEDARAGSRADEVLTVLEDRIRENVENKKNTGKAAGENDQWTDLGEKNLTDGVESVENGTSGGGGSPDTLDTVPLPGPSGSQNARVGSDGHSVPDYELFPDMEMPTEEINGVRYIGEIYCPKIKRGSPIIYSWSMDLLKIAPCRYSGTVYGHDLVIASHNYTRHLGRMLRLRAGDDVYFTDVQGNVFHYRVIDREELPPSDVRSMVVKQDEADWDLTVFTCTMSGQTRMAIRCELVGTDPA